MSDQVDFPTLVREINQRLAKRQTGTLFLKSDDGHAYAVACQGGTITGVWSGTTVGNSAVEKLCSIKKATYRFNPAVHTPFGSKPDPSYVSRLLGTGVKNRPVAINMLSDGQGETQFHQRALEAIRTNLLDLLGPFGTFILDGVLSSAPYEYVTPENLQYFLSTLAAEFDDDKQASSFVRSTNSVLNIKLAS